MGGRDTWCALCGAVTRDLWWQEEDGGEEDCYDHSVITEDDTRWLEECTLVGPWSPEDEDSENEEQDTPPLWMLLLMRFTAFTSSQPPTGTMEPSSSILKTEEACYQREYITLLINPSI